MDYDILIEQISDSDDKAGQIIFQLVNEGISVLPSILNAIRNGPSHSIIMLVQVVLQLTDPKIKDEMLVLLDDKNRYIRSVAYRVLSKFKDQDVVEKFEEKLQSTKFSERDIILAATAIGEGNHFNSLPILKKLLVRAVDTESIYYSPDIILAIAHSMAKLGDNSALPYVLELYENKDPVVILKTIKQLSFFCGSGVFKVLKNALYNPIREIREDALDGLFLIGTKSAAQQIWNSCKDKEPDISQRAMYRLTQITGKKVETNYLVKEFDEWLDKNDIELNNKCCFRFGQPIDVPMLVKKITEPKPEKILLEELFVITGNRFGHDPEVWIYAKQPDYNVLVNSWLQENESRYITGKLYKFGFLQDLSLMHD